MQHRNAVMIIAAAVLGGFAATPASAHAQAVDHTGAWRLVEVAGAALPFVSEDSDGCREEVSAATLTLEADGDYVLETIEREICGDVVEQDDDREEGEYRIEGTAVRFDEEDDDDDANDEDVDIDDLVVGTVSADGLTVRLDDGRTVLVFRR